MSAKPPSSPGSGADLLPLTAARGIAAWWVVLFHFRAFLAPWLPPQVVAFLGEGNLAVDFFFILSGFVIYLNYAGRVSGWRSAGDFLFRRFARVYPLHLLMLLGFAAYFGAAALSGPERLWDYRPGYFLASLFLVQNWGFAGHLGWNVPAWSISTEAFAYLLFPFLLLVLAPARRSGAFLGGAVALLGLSVPAFFLAFGHDFPDAVPATGLFRCVVQFAMGALLCELYQRMARCERLAVPFAAAAACLVIACIAISALLVPLLWASLIMALALAPRRNPLSWGPLVWLGEISYATYLCHYLALVVWKYLFVQAGVPVPPALLAAYLAAVLIGSALLYHGFERPAQRRMLDWWKGRSRASAASRPALGVADGADEHLLVARAQPARAKADPGDGGARRAGDRLAAGRSAAGGQPIPRA